MGAQCCSSNRMAACLCAMWRGSTSSKRAWCATTPPRPSCEPTRRRSTNTWECERRDGVPARDPVRPAPDPDGQRHRHRHDPGAGRLRADPDLRHHGRRQLRTWRIVHAGRLCRRGDPRGYREFLGRPRGGDAADRAARRGAARDDLAPAARPRPADDDPRHLRDLTCVAKLRPVAVRPGGAQDPRAVHRAVHALLPPVSLVPAADRAALGRHHRRALPVPQIRHLRDLDPRHDPGPHHGAGDGDPGALGAHRRVRDRLRHGGGERGLVRALGRGQPRDGGRLGAEGFYRRRGRRHGQSRRLDPGRDFHQPVGSLCRTVRRAVPGGHCLLRGADPDPPVPADGALRANPEMRNRHAIAYWTGFGLVVALLAVAPLVLPEFWRRFLTEILIRGLLAMSSDILIGYTGIVSFGHSAFFGLGMYGAAAALITMRPPSLWLALPYGLVAAAAVAAFVAYFSTRLRDIYFAITTLIFSQIFYVVIFTWTEVTGGENGLTFSRPPLAIPGLFSMPFTSTTLHWFVLAVVVISYLILRRITQSPFGMVLQSIRENEARTRAVGYPTERYKIVAVMLSGLFAGLAGVLYAVQNRFAAPDFVYFLVSGETVIFNVIGGIGTLVGPIVGAAFFLLLRETLSRFFTEFYLIPVGVIFIAMVIFMPQGLLGFARRWLNR